MKPKKSQTPKELYPMIKKVGLEIVDTPIKHIPFAILNAKLIELKLEETFKEEFGQQTCIPEGLYAWDVEECFERIFSGRKQLLFQWD